mmetsp:Transcript_17248/g.27873  ORF Transcript_17248/g.27873 Transcript_17248/m.27873 type:complete len:87 (-) Transcript_17248:246-506(-)
MVRHSGLQKDVLRLYKRALKAAKLKDAGLSLKNSVGVVKAEFRENAQQVSRRDFRKIEYLLRQGERKVETIERPSVKKVSTFTIKR